MVGKIIIRTAQNDDVKHMAGLLAELFSIEDDFVIDRDTQILGLQLLLETSYSTVLVAQMDHCVVGMVSMQCFISTAVGGKVGLIEDMIVTRDFRRMGIGGMLLKAMIHTSEDLGYARLSLGADMRNHTAIALYRTFGFETSNMGLMYRIA
ncbi:MAG: GNAT family N-acetyltransferase [Sulfuricurvum sp.]|nr:GNAT family N-acetyltransferase [Sulfuricurvum sp.]